MSDTVLVAAITGFCTLAGSCIAGFVAYKVAVRKEREKRLCRKAQKALCDLLAYKRLEDLYTKHLAESTGSSPEAEKKRAWNELRDANIDTPSEDAEPRRIREAIKRLEDNC